MRTTLAAKEFGLPSRTVIEQIDDKTIALVMKRKSRIIMADGRKIKEKVESIKALQPEMQVVLEITAPVCSKTSTFLGDAGIQINTIEG